MITVTMMDGTCRQYNRARASQEFGEWLWIASGRPISDNMITQIRLSQIKMWEWEAPCRVYKPTKPKAKR